jgi:hydroxyacylglutathione hydrolase
LLKYKVIPILNDNYVFVIYDEILKIACVVDPGSFSEVKFFLLAENLDLVMILITHHHHDHIGGVQELISQFHQCKVYSSKMNLARLDFVDYYVSEEDVIPFRDTNFSVIELSGHTLDHIAFYLKDYGWLFSGDVLFGLGCGRVFEGTMDQAYDSLQKIKSYPAQTLVFCTHEYTKVNLDFCQRNFPSLNLDEYAIAVLDLIQQNRPTIPLVLGNEILNNPFLTAQNAFEFAERRELRNNW